MYPLELSRGVYAVVWVQRVCSGLYCAWYWVYYIVRGELSIIYWVLYIICCTLGIGCVVCCVVCIIYYISFILFYIYQVNWFSLSRSFFLSLLFVLSFLFFLSLILSPALSLSFLGARDAPIPRIYGPPPASSGILCECNIINWFSCKIGKKIDL